MCPARTHRLLQPSTRQITALLFYGYDLDVILSHPEVYWAHAVTYTATLTRCTQVKWSEVIGYTRLECSRQAVAGKPRVDLIRTEDFMGQVVQLAG